MVPEHGHSLFLRTPEGIGDRMEVVKNICTRPTLPLSNIESHKYQVHALYSCMSMDDELDII